nr:DUF2760 domain-containing protein [uncultured Rhodopila sp.]
MKAVSIIAVLLLLAANAFALLLALNQFVLPPAAEAYVLAPKVNVFKLPPSALSVLPYVAAGSLALGVIALIAILAIRTRSGGARAARPMSASVLANQAEAEIVSFLATLQSKGRLVDFLMDDINAFSDAQVGAAARVVHAGCKSVLDEHFKIRPIREGSEGSKVEVPAGYPADEYRLLGKISGQAPFSGTLVHHGWKTDSVKLPTILRSSADRLPAIAPAEVELKQAARA